MAKIVKSGKWEYSEAELQLMYETATRRGEEAIKTEKQAHAVRYDQTTNRLILELKNNVTVMLPCDLIQGLADAAPIEIAEVELGARGASLHWEKLDQDFSVNGLVNGIFGTQKWMENLKSKNSNPSNSSLAETHRQSGTDRKKVA
jgi:hypothetical protein